VVWLAALLGLFVGAALNYLADQLPARQRIGPPPQCAHCATPRPPLSWVGTVAYVTGRFRCLSCGAPLSVRHPVTEVATAVAFALLFQAQGPSVSFAFSAFYLCVFLLVLITDLEHHLIFNVVMLPATLVALAAPFVLDKPTPKSAFIGAAVGFGFFYVIALLKPGGMGAGDVKLAAFIGAVTGFPAVFSALLIGIFAGGFVALILVATGVKGMKSYIPYGPFLVLGGALITFLGPTVAQWVK